MKKHNFYEGMIPVPDDFEELQSNAEEALRESSAALGGVGVLEGLEPRLDSAANKLIVEAGKGLRKDGQLLKLEVAQDLSLPSDSKAYAVVLRYRSAETQERTTTLQGEDTWTDKEDESYVVLVDVADKQAAQAQDLVLGTLQGGALDLSKREVAQGWQAVRAQAQDLQGFKHSTAQNFDRAEHALKQSRAALGGVGVLEGLELKLDGTAKKLTVELGKALRKDGQLLTLKAAQDLRLPSDSANYSVVLRHQAHNNSAKAQLEQNPQASDVVLGTLQGGALDLRKREVARGWPSLTSAPFEVKDAFVTLNADEQGVGISRGTQHLRTSSKLINYRGAFSPRHVHQALVYQNKLWVLGGYDGNNRNDVWSFDGTTWTQQSNGGFSPRHEHQALVYQNKLWVIGGSTNSGWSNDLWSFDGSTWTPQGNGGFSPRREHQAVVYQNKIWVLGGFDGNYCNDVWSFDGSTWTPQGNGGFSPRYEHQAVVYQGKLWVIGGYTSSGRSNNVWSFDGSTWTPRGNGGFSPRDDHQAVVYQNKLWVLGGATNSGRSNELWSFDGSAWKEESTHDASTTTRFSPRYEHQAAVYDNKLWVIGGNTNGDYSNEVWCFDGRAWREFAIEESAQRAEKPLAGLRVRRGSRAESLLAYNEEVQAWEIDGQEVLRLSGGLRALVDFVRRQALDAIVPRGFIYAQYPGQQHPQTIWGSSTQWERLSKRDLRVQMTDSSGSTSNYRVQLYRRIK